MMLTGPKRSIAIAAVGTFISSLVTFYATGYYWPRISSYNNPGKHLAVWMNGLRKQDVARIKRDVIQKVAAAIERIESLSSSRDQRNHEIQLLVGDLRTVLSELQNISGARVDATGRSNVSGEAAANRPTFKSGDVCPELHTAYTPPNADTSRSHKGCKGVPAFNTLLTMVYNFVHYSSEDLPHIPRLLNSVNKVYPGIAILAALPSDSKLTDGEFNHTTFVKYDKSTAETDIWNQLIAKVQTKYVYIGRNVIHFTWFDRLERLVREVNNLGAYAVASAFRTLHSGHWSTGCEQTTLRNYTLVYRHGYDMSMDGCMVCHHVQGPFISKAELFKTIPFRRSMTGTSGFAIWFLTLMKHKKIAVSCPDSMSFVKDDSQLPSRRVEWSHLAKALQVEKVYPNPHTLFEFGCAEANTECAQTRGFGMALSHCCMNKLMKANKLIMKLCREHNLTCESQSGTLLGATKLNGVLPWEIDGDFYIETSAYDEFEKKMSASLAMHGYYLEVHRGNPELIYFVVRLKRREWFVEVFSMREDLDSTVFARQGLPPTTVYYDGMYLSTYASPGLYCRNRYPGEAFQHVQHWRHLGLASGWEIYDTGKFTKCSKPGHHGCLDQFVGDGNIQFRLP